MYMKYTHIAAAVTGAVMLAGSASATVVANIGDGQTFCESLSSSAFSANDCDLGGNRDLSNSASTADSLTFLGSGRLSGFVADDAGINANRFPDWVNITLTQDSQITFNLVQPTEGFDTSFEFGGLVSSILTTTDSSLSFFASAGTYLFGLNAALPDGEERSVSSYTFDVAAVPVPAAGWLLFAGLGGLVAARRKRKA